MAFDLTFVLRAETRPPDTFDVTHRATKGTLGYPGTSVLHSTWMPEPLYVPHKGRELKALSTVEPLSFLVDKILPWAEGVNPGARGLVYVEQKTPYSLHLLSVSEGTLYLYGLYDDTHDVLLISTQENVDELLRRRASPSAPSPWLYRFRPITHATISLNTERICRKWSTWVHHPQSRLKSSAQRFAVLETLLLD